MRGIHFANGEIAYRDDLPEPEVKSGECRVQILHAGICATDLALARGFLGFSGIPGHEFVGRALEGRYEGQRVVGEINAGCGACEWCWAAMERHCPHRTVLGILGRPGCFTEMIALPQRNLRPVSSSISNEAAVFVEPVAAAFEILDQVPIEKHMSVLVAGDGRLGLLCAHVLALHGAKVTLAGRHPERQDLLPADVRHVTGLLEGDPPEAKDLFPLAVEATGKPEVLEALLPFMRPRATLILKTTSEAPAPLNLALAVIHEITVLGSRCGRFEPAIRALEREAIPVERWIHGRYPLEKGVEAIHRAGEPGVLKIILDVEAE